MDEQSSRQVTGQLSLRATATATVTRMTHLWIRWAEVAVDSERLSLTAKRQREPQNPPVALGSEFSHGMVAVCASMFAMDAITWALAKKVIPETAEKWRGQSRPPSSLNMMQQVLGHTIDGTTANAIISRWKKPLESRHEAVHFWGDSRPSVCYDGLNVSVEDANYSSDAATQAVDLLLETLEEITSRPKTAASEWGKGFRGQVQVLRHRRNT